MVESESPQIYWKGIKTSLLIFFSLLHPIYKAGLQGEGRTHWGVFKRQVTGLVLIRCSRATSVSVFVLRSPCVKILSLQGFKAPARVTSLILSWMHFQEYRYIEISHHQLLWRELAPLPGFFSPVGKISASYDTCFLSLKRTVSI